MLSNLLVALGLAFSISFFVAGIILKKKVGTLRIDQSDPDGPYLFLELDKPVYAFLHKKYVVLEVEAKDFIPHQ